MKSFIQNIKSSLASIGKKILKKNRYDNRRQSPSVSHHHEQLESETDVLSGLEDYQDKHIYRYMDPSDKKKPVPIPLKAFPKKDVYKCFGWQLHPYDIQKLAEYIDHNPRLARVKTKSVRAGAAEADILILTSGSGKYHIDSFLCDLDTSKKMIIIASVRDLNSVKEDITHRIDYHFNKLHPFTQADFNIFIDQAISKSTAQNEDKNDLYTPASKNAIG